MQKLLNKRVFRDLKKNFVPYFALFLLVVLGMYMVVSMVGASESIIQTVNNSAEENLCEDGEFSVFTPLEDDTIKKLSNKGVLLEECFYLDYILDDQSTVRIYKNRENINLIVLSEGKLAKLNTEIVLEKHYAESNGYTVGSQILIGDKKFKVTGICTTPDYDSPLKELSDANADSISFGNGFVTDESYDNLKKKENAVKSEVYNYAYRLNNSMTDKELKEYLEDIKVDIDNIEDQYLREIIDKQEEPKNDIEEGIDELSDGTSELKDGLSELTDVNDEINEGVTDLFDKTLDNVSNQLALAGVNVKLTRDNYGEVLDELSKKMGGDGATQLKDAKKQLDELSSFCEGMSDYTQGTLDAYDGAEALNDGVQELNDKAEEIIEEYFSVEISNLVVFLKSTDNPRIKASVNDVQINRSIGMVAGIIITILFAYVISVFVIQNIQRECSVIGALYALGVKKRQLIQHYLVLPMLITFAGGCIGTIIGFSPLGIDIQATNTTNYFSIPILETVYPIYLIVYGIIMPPVLSAVVNYLVINKRLSQTALSLMRNQQKDTGAKNIKVKTNNFVLLFQIRQFLREIRSAIAVVGGMFIALLILMMGVECHTLSSNIRENNDRDIGYEYMYTFKYPTEKVPDGGEACYIETLKKEAYGYDLDVTILGIDDDNPYFDFDVEEGQNVITASSAFANKYKASIGDKIVLSNEIDEKDYGFTVANIENYSAGLYVFMDIDSMRELFDQEEDYYNAVLSEDDLDIESGRLNNITSKEDILKSSDVFINQMQTLVIILITVAILIFIVVMYLMVKVMIDHSAFSISMMKIFGYRQKELQKLYLNGNFILIVIASIICIPLTKNIMDVLYPYFLSNVANGFDLTFEWYKYVLIFVGIIFCYFVISQLLVSRLRKIVPAEVLKNRE